MPPALVQRPQRFVAISLSFSRFGKKDTDDAPRNSSNPAVTFGRVGGRYRRVLATRLDVSSRGDRLATYFPTSDEDSAPRKSRNTAIFSDAVRVRYQPAYFRGITFSFSSQQTLTLVDSTVTVSKSLPSTLFNNQSQAQAFPPELAGGNAMCAVATLLEIFQS